MESADEGFIHKSQWDSFIMLAKALELLENSPVGNKWDCPFPMAVFGTLRISGGNDSRMGVPIAEKKNNRAAYSSHHKAFLRNYVAKGLGIYYEEGASAPFEIFTYTPDEWKLMIPSVDALESFSPANVEINANSYGYHRTLAWLHVLPDDYPSGYFTVNGMWGGNRNEIGRYGDSRDLKIPRNKWNDYKTVPCWIYNSVREIKKAEQSVDSPIIWYGL